MTDVSEEHIVSNIALMMGAVRAPETSAYFNETTRRCIPEGNLFICSLFTVAFTVIKLYRIE
jgi:hypothetical protein